MNDKVKTITPNPPDDFTPEFTQPEHIGAFRFWCQKVLPLVYDDSLSYYEVLCKVVAYLNTVIKETNELGQDVTNLMNAYNQLQEYVNNYFSSLDVQDEINNKLDEMVADGTLTGILAKYLNVIITPDMFGAIGDGITDDSDAIIEMFSKTSKIYCFPKDKKYLANKQIIIPSNSIIIGYGSIIATFKNEDAFENNFSIGSISGENIYIQNIKFIGNINNNSYANLCFNNCKNVVINNCIFKDIYSSYSILFANDCIDINIKNSIFDGYSYSAISAIKKCTNLSIYKCKIINNFDLPENEYLMYPISISGTYDYTIDFNAYNVLIDSCYIETKYDYWEQIDAHGGKNITIQNCVLKGNRIGIALQKVGKSNDSLLENITIKNNYIELATTITKVTQENGFNAGIAISNGKNVLIDNNVIYNGGILARALNNTVEQTAGIVLSGSDIFKVENNKIYNSVVGIQTRSGDTDCFLTIANNYIETLFTYLSDYTEKYLMRLRNNGISEIYNNKFNDIDGSTITIQADKIEKTKSYIKNNINNPKSIGFRGITSDYYPKDYTLQSFINEAIYCDIPGFVANCNNSNYYMWTGKTWIDLNKIASTE